MDDEARNWRDAKTPQWVKDSIAAEIKAWELTAALSWPTEPKPAPLPFRWGDYDILHGEPVPGTYWSVSSTYAQCAHIRSKQNGDEGWKEWRFSRDGEKWSVQVARGPLFATEREALLWVLWEICEAAADNLMRLRIKL